MATESMGLREFGRWVDKTGEAVRKAIATGKIPPDCVGQKALSSGRMVPVITDPERARKAWGQNVDPNQVRDKRVMSESRAAAHARARGEEPKEQAAERDDESGAPLTAGKGIPTIAQSKAITEAYKARLAKLEYEERSGKLVNADQIKIKTVGMIKGAVNRLRGVPSKAKGLIPTLTVRDIEVLEDLIDEALQEVASGGR